MHYVTNLPSRAGFGAKSGLSLRERERLAADVEIVTFCRLGNPDRRLPRLG